VLGNEHIDKLFRNRVNPKTLASRLGPLHFSGNREANIPPRYSLVLP
jgi:hypothetical protein